jgi:thioredoxin 1
MKKQILVFALPFIALVVLLGGYIFLNGGAEKSGEVTQQSEQNTQVQMAPKVSYAFYTPELIAQLAKNRRVLFFYAAWCPTCKEADNDFTENLSQIPADVTVIKVNYKDSQTDEQEKVLAKKYGITYQHTFVQIDADGNEITKWNGGGITELLENLK